MTTILDVIDNYFSLHPKQDMTNLPGRELFRFGEEVRRFSASYEPEPFNSNMYPVYLGGWPSANFFAADQGQLVLTTLLYSGQVLVKDPISDWFAPERYKIAHTISNRQGYLHNDGRPNIAGTRQFLANVVPALRRLRPLIQSGAIVLAPSEAFYADHKDSVEKLHENLMRKLGNAGEEITDRFHPADIAVDDRQRGGFVFAGGGKEEGLRRVVDHSLRYFAREWLLSQRYGVEYTALWPYEQYICESGLDELLRDTEHRRVVNAVLHSQLPIYQGLNPKIVADIRDDDTFADLRAKLFEVYRGIPSLGTGTEFQSNLAQTEETVLRPVLNRAEQAAKQGFLHRLTVGLAQATFSIGARLAFDSQTGHLGWETVGSESIGVIADHVRFSRTSRSPITAWTKLYRHHRSIAAELRNVEVQPSSPPTAEPWKVSDKPSMDVQVTSGLVLFDGRPLPKPPEPTGYSEGSYRPCDCGSGLKWKFCCQGLNK